MTQQPLLLEDVPRRRRKAINVPRTSVLAGQAVNKDARVSRILGELVSLEDADHPTSHELASAWTWPDAPSLAQLLEVRRGLSDALAAGLVEHAGERKCSISGRRCKTWRLRQR